MDLGITLTDMKALPGTRLKINGATLQTDSTPRDLIYLVEDSPTQARRTRFVLEQADCSVKICATGLEALEAVAAQEPDLILLDLNLPDINGREVAQQIKIDPLKASIPIIFLTGMFLDNQDLVHGLAQGADDYIRKPVRDDELVARVKASLRARKTQRELTQLVRALLLVNQIGSQLGSILDFKTLLTAVTHAIHESFAYPYVQLYLQEGAELILVAINGADTATWLASAHLGDIPPRLPLQGHSFIAHCMAQPAVRALIRAPDELVSHPFLPQISSLAAVPLQVGGQWFGALEIASPKPCAFGASDGLVLETLAGLVSMAIHNARLYRELAEKPAQ